MHQSDTTPVKTTLQTILIVDDVNSVRYYHEYIMKKAGFRCEVACDGQEALVKLQQNRIDLLILDIMMPKLNGLQLIGQLRSNPAYAKIPILVISSEPVGDQICLARTAEAGPIGFAKKPITPTSMFQEMYRLLGETP